MDNVTFLATAGNWFKKPFDSQGSAFTWIMFVGLIIIATWLWSSVLRTMTKEI